MPVLLIAVIDDAARIWDVIDAWERVGVHNATILDSTGLHRARGLREDLPLFPSVHDLLQTEGHHRTLWSVLPDGVDPEAVVRVTEEVVGSLDEPRRGILFTVPVLKVWGLRTPTSGE